MRLVFLDPAARDLYLDRDRVALNSIASLRAVAGADVDDPLLTELVGELSIKSGEFRRMWARHDVRGKGHEAKRFDHPLVGELTLAYEALTINSAPGQQLIVYEAEPGSPSEHALALLGSTIAEQAEPVSAPRAHERHT